MKGKRVLLVNPWIYDFAAYDFWAKPLGLLYLGSILEENGFRVDLIDLLDVHHPLLERSDLKRPKRKEDGRGHLFREEVEKPPPLKGIPRRFYRFGMPPDLFREALCCLPTPDLILVTSGMTYWYLGVRETIKVIKEIFPTVPVFLGGIYASLLPDHARRHSGADRVIPGRGEETVARIIREMGGDGSPVLSPSDPDDLPYPAFHLYRKLDYVSILASRGCPFRCPYCASHLLYPGVRRRRPEKVAQEIVFWAEVHGIKDFAFYDDALLLSPDDLFIPLLEELKDRGLGVRFHTPNALHARGIDERVAEMMREVGFRTIRIGLETIAPQEKVSAADFRKAVSSLTHAGYSPEEIGAYILVGLPHQRREEVEDTIKFVWDCGARPYLAEYSPIPGTDLWEEAKKASPFPIAEEPLFQNNTLLPCRWEGLSWDDLRELKEMVKTPI